MEVVVFGGLQLLFILLVCIGEILDQDSHIGRRVDRIVDRGADIRVALELARLGQKIESLVLIGLCRVTRGQEFHDLIDPLPVDLVILGGLRWSAQVFLELDSEDRIVPHGQERVRLHVDDVFLGLQVCLKHRLAADRPVVHGTLQGITLFVLLSHLMNGVRVGNLR